MPGNTDNCPQKQVAATSLAAILEVPSRFWPVVAIGEHNLLHAQTKTVMHVSFVALHFIATAAITCFSFAFAAVRVATLILTGIGEQICIIRRLKAYIPGAQTLHPATEYELGKSCAPAVRSMSTTWARPRLRASMRGVSLLPSRCSVVFDNVNSCEITGCKFCMQKHSEISTLPEDGTHSYFTMHSMGQWRVDRVHAETVSTSKGASKIGCMRAPCQ